MSEIKDELLISDSDFRRMVSYVQSNYGIDLHAKRQLINSRLANVVKGKGFHDFKEYVDYLLSKGTGDDINELLSKLTTNYTYFQRETESFDFYVKTILPEITKRHNRDKILSIWSAACSSGEEPYNVTMYMMDYFGAKWGAWDARMLAGISGAKISAREVMSFCKTFWFCFDMLLTWSFETPETPDTAAKSS